MTQTAKPQHGPAPSQPIGSTVAATPDAPGLFLALAPMDGITDAVYRDLLTSLAGGNSGISLCVTEFVRVTHEAVPAHVLRRECPELGRQQGLTRTGVPVFVQLLGGSPGPMADTARAAADLGAPGIDVNFGCPAKTVNRSDGGAVLLQAPRRVASIVSAIRAAVPVEVPISVKIRLGWEDSARLEDLARAAEGAGAAWLTIHARTRLQLYRPPVDWVALSRARQAVRIPIVANGDIDTPRALDHCAQQSGCNAFMVGRGAMARPRLFREIRGWDSRELTLPEKSSILLRYADALLNANAPERTALGRLKQWLRLGAVGCPDMAQLFTATKRLPQLDAMLEAIAQTARMTTQKTAGSGTAISACHAPAQPSPPECARDSL